MWHRVCFLILGSNSGRYPATVNKDLLSPCRYRKTYLNAPAHLGALIRYCNFATYCTKSASLIRLANFSRWCVAAALASAAFTCCTTRLDINPSADIPEEVALATPLAIENQLESVYALIADSNVYGGSFYEWPTILADAATQRYPGDEGELFNYRFHPSDLRINRAWQAAYQAINRCNLILERCKDEKPLDLDYSRNRNRFRGEALCLRSIIYFDLVRLFCQQSHTGEALQGVVLRLTPVSGRDGAALTTTDKVLAQIEADLREAIPLLDPLDYPLRTAPLGNGINVVGHVTATTAYGYLACMYFQQQSMVAGGNDPDPTKALDAINACIGPIADVPNIQSLTSASGQAPPLPELHPLNRNLIDLFGQKGTDLPTNPTTPDKSEIIFQILSSQQIIGQRRSAYLSGKFVYDPLRGFGNPQYEISDTIIGRLEGINQTLFYTGTRGQRYLNFYSRIPGPYTVRKLIQSVAINYPVLRSAQLLLSRAELLAFRNQGNDLRDAVSDLAINKFRAGSQLSGLEVPSTNTGYLNSLPVLQKIADRGKAGSLASRDTILSEIRRERVRELLWEPDRLYDLKRRRLLISAVGNRPSVDAASLALPVPDIETINNLAL